MILIFLRIVFGAGFIYYARQAWNYPPDRADAAGDLGPAYFLAVSVVLGILNGAVWAPYIGEKLSDPLTGAVTRGAYVERRNLLLALIRRLDARGFRRLTSWLCFLEGIHHPELPAAFVIGMETAKPGSWLEKVYAREVFRFENAQNCARAFKILESRGIDPRPHRNPEVNRLLASLERSVKPDAKPIPMAVAPAAKGLVRNPKIRLFQAGEPRSAPSQILEPQRGAGKQAAE